LKKYAGVRYDKTLEEHQKVNDELKQDYERVKIWLDRVQQELFPDGYVKILRKATDQAGNFIKYTWGRLYPSKRSPEELAYTLGTDAEHGFVIKLDVTRNGDLRTRCDSI